MEFTGGRALRHGQISRVLHGVSFEIRSSEAFGLVGESGSGKSTLARAVLRLIEVTEGQVIFHGRDLLTLGAREMRALRADLQIVFQDPVRSMSPRMRVRDYIVEPLRLHSDLDGEGRSRAAKRLMEDVGLDPEMGARFPHEFSGGQRQRLAIARAIATSPSLLICDEPVSALDVSVQAQILRLLNRLRVELGMALLFISHDLAVVRYIAERVGVLYLGRLVEVGRTGHVFQHPRHPYTVALLNAVPQPNERLPKRLALKTELAAEEAGAEGCSFRDRCWLYRRLGNPSECENVSPSLDGVNADTHGVACHFAEKTVELATEAGFIHSRSQNQVEDSVG